MADTEAQNVTIFAAAAIDEGESSVNPKDFVDKYLL